MLRLILNGLYAILPLTLIIYNHSLFEIYVCVALCSLFLNNFKDSLNEYKRTKSIT